MNTSPYLPYLYLLNFENHSENTETSNQNFTYVYVMAIRNVWHWHLRNILRKFKTITNIVIIAIKAISFEIEHQIAKSQDPRESDLVLNHQ